ncbi:glycosyltransferase family 4 protein [Seonamhaeicola maritimus]|uniref:Glycosyltransferase family 4 protein n=1 Tax=Seonamhaeicola maritimus TaxID=2591822 RepID=A0A5C7GKX9_9FLAO|nr:glycosyltransferase family 4 protein [Seonamhaeicola maritimus]TXG38875.1 glycosyltransferase family 4 protein [Seonamhaeicola maritimus]
MNIGIVLSKTPSYSETFFISKIKGLQNHGFDVTLFVQDKTNDFSLCYVRKAPKVFNRNPPLQIITFLVMFFKILPFWSRIIRFINLEVAANRSWFRIIKNIYNNAHILRADLDWVHFGFTTLSLNSEHVAKAIGAKMAVSFRGFDLDLYPLKHPHCYDILWKQVDRVHSISKYLLNKALVLGLPDTIPYDIITPAVKIKKKSSPRDSHAILKFVTVARLHWIKGLSETLEALRMLKSRDVKFKYIIIGQGDEYEALKFAISQLNLEWDVELLGRKSHEETLYIIEDADIYLQYSYSEGFCNAVLEAQACGVLCVVSDGGGLNENIIHEETGWIVPKRRPELLADRMYQVVKLPANKKYEIRYNAFQRVENSFTLEKQSEAFLNFYNEHIN